MRGSEARADALVEARAGRRLGAHGWDATRRRTRAARRGQTRHPDSRVREALAARRGDAHHRASVTGVERRCIDIIPWPIDALRGDGAGGGDADGVWRLAWQSHSVSIVVSVERVVPRDPNDQHSLPPGVVEGAQIGCDETRVLALVEAVAAADVHDVRTLVGRIHD